MRRERCASGGDARRVHVPTVRQDRAAARLCVYCAECAAIVAERRAQRPSAPAVRIRRVWIDRKRRIYKEYRGTFPAAMFVGLDVEDNYEAAA